MEFIKKLFSAIFLSLVISLPLLLLESFLIFSLIDLYKIPYLVNFNYSQFLGICFIIMITRNRTKFLEHGSKREPNLEDIFNSLIDRFFRIIFVWAVALSIHELFLR